MEKPVKKEVLPAQSYRFRETTAWVNGYNLAMDDRDKYDAFLASNEEVKSEDWEEEFDKRFNGHGFTDHDCKNFLVRDNAINIKSFIRSIVKPKSELDVDKVKESMLSVLKRLDPNTDGVIFIRDNNHTPPNNWSQIHLNQLAKAICSKFSKPKIDREGLALALWKRDGCNGKPAVGEMNVLLNEADAIIKHLEVK